MEVWKDIEEFEGIYQVSSRGRVKSLPRIDTNGRKHEERVLKPGKAGNYLHVHLSKGNKASWHTVHRLVASAFLEKKEGCDVVNHIDNNPHNNDASNLEWTTLKGNMQHASKQGRMHYNPENLKKAQERHKKPVVAIDEHGNHFYFKSAVDAKNALKLSHSQRGRIANACKNHKTVGGYTWRYA